MVIKELLAIISTLPEETVILIDETDVNEVETIEVQYHSNGRTHLILSTAD